MANREKRLLDEMCAEKQRSIIRKVLKQTSDKDFLLRKVGLGNTPLAETLLKQCPKIVRSGYSAGISLLETHRSEWIRPLSEWVPRGKGTDSLFISLVNHLLVKYPMPKFLYRILLKGEERHFFSLFMHLTQGGSLFKVVGTDMMPVPLTRRLCHEFLSLPSETRGVIEGIRTVQISSHGGTHKMRGALLRTALGRVLHPKEDEPFWDTVIRWFCDNPMLDTDQVGPLMDYINHCRTENRAFSMKGRSVMAMINGMREWHEILGKIRRLRGVEFKPSGLREVTWRYKRPEPTGGGIDVWMVKEILNSKELAAEGRALRHCVLSYAQSIVAGRCSIWSVRKNDERMITMEVNSAGRSVCQARGFANRSPKSMEATIIRRWAALNDLGMAAYLPWMQ